MRLWLTAATAAALLAVLPASAQSAFFGSKLNRPANVSFGCEVAPILDPIFGGPQLAPTGQKTCTYRHGGYVNSNRIVSFVPTTGRITRIRVRAGRNPAPLRLTILTASSRISSEGPIAGSLSCCTARY